MIPQKADKDGEKIHLCIFSSHVQVHYLNVDNVSKSIFPYEHIYLF